MLSADRPLRSTLQFAFHQSSCPASNRFLPSKSWHQICKWVNISPFEVDWPLTTFFYRRLDSRIAAKDGKRSTLSNKCFRWSFEQNKSFVRHFLFSLLFVVCDRLQPSNAFKFIRCFSSIIDFHRCRFLSHELWLVSNRFFVLKCSRLDCRCNVNVVFILTLHKKLMTREIKLSNDETCLKDLRRARCTIQISHFLNFSSQNCHLLRFQMSFEWRRCHKKLQLLSFSHHPKTTARLEKGVWRVHNMTCSVWWSSKKWKMSRKRIKNSN